MYEASNILHSATSQIKFALLGMLLILTSAESAAFLEDGRLTHKPTQTAAIADSKAWPFGGIKSFSDDSPMSGPAGAHPTQAAPQQARSALAFSDEFVAKVVAAVEFATGSDIRSSYENGRKHLLVMSAPYKTLTIQLIIDLDDLARHTQEGQNGWVSYWVTYRLSFSQSVSIDPSDGLLGFLDVFGNGVKVVTHDRSLGVDDPRMRFNFTLLNASTLGLSLTAMDVGYGGTDTLDVDFSEFDWTSFSGSVEALATTGTLLSGEIRQSLFLSEFGNALLDQAGAINFSQLIGAAVDIFVSFDAIPFSFLLRHETEHRRLTASDAPPGAGAIPPYVETIMHIGVDGNGDVLWDGHVPPSGNGTIPQQLYPAEVIFYSSTTHQKDYRLNVEGVPEGWEVIARGRDEEELGDKYYAFNRETDSPWTTQWWIGCTEDAVPRANITFLLYEPRLVLPDILLDTEVAALSCSTPPDADGGTQHYRVVVDKEPGAAGGLIDASVTDLTCHAGCLQSMARLAEGTTIVLNASTDPGTSFAGWAGDCSGQSQCSLTVNRDLHISAVFNPDSVSGTAPQAPSNLQASALDETRIQLDWNEPATGETSVLVERRSQESTGWFRIKRLPANTESFLNTHLIPGEEYEYRVLTENAFGASGFSNIAKATTESIAPNAPSDLTGWALRDTKIALSWRDSNSGSASYEVEKSADGNSWSRIGTTSTGGSSFSAFVEKLSTNFFRVRAKSSVRGVSPYSQPISVTACAYPGSPQHDSPYSGEDDVSTDALLSWRGNDEVGSYDLYFGTQNPPPLHIQDITAPNLGDDISIDPGFLEEGATYYWSVAAKALCDPSKTNASEVRFFSTVGAPNAPLLLKPEDSAVGVPTGVVVDWENVTSDGTVLYSLYFGDTNPPPFFEDVSTRTEKLIEGLSANTTYYWQVAARSAENPLLSSESDVWSFVTGDATTLTVVLDALQDAGLRAGVFGNMNYGGQPTSDAEQTQFGLGNDDNLYQDVGNEALRGAVEFDLSSVPAGATIINATLTLPWVSGSGSQNAPLDMIFAPFSGPWAESTITWNNRPGRDSANSVTGTFPLSGFNPTQNDLTPLVQKWIDGTVANNGVEISIPGWEAETFRAKYFLQKEATGPASTMQVTYGEPCIAPTTPTAPSPASGITGVGEGSGLSWSPAPEAAGYRVFFGADPSPALLSTTAVPSIDALDLSPATDYYWRVEAFASCDSTKISTSPTWQFRTNSCFSPDFLELQGPSDGGSGIGQSVLLEWTGSADIGEYGIFLDEENPPQTLRALTSDQQATVTLLPGRSYFWQVKGLASCDQSKQRLSGVRTFSTSGAPVADAGVDKIVAPGDSAALGASPAATSGEPPYSFSWVFSPRIGVLVSDSTSANPSVELSGIGGAEATLFVTDSNGFRSAPSTVNVSADPTEFVFGSGFEE